MKSRLPGVGAVVLMVLVAGRVNRAAGDDAPVATAPAVPQTQPAHVSDDARQLLDQISAAYGKLHSLNLDGTLTVELQIEGSDAKQHAARLHSSFVSPNKFRHEMKDDVLVGSTGQKLYTFLTEDNAYTQDDAPHDRVASKDLPKAVATLLSMQDPSLLLAMSKSAADELLEDVTDASKADDTRVDGVSCPTLKLVQKDNTNVLASLDPQTHLLRRFQTDMTGYFKKRRPDFAKAVVTIDYKSTRPDAEATKDEMFAWSPPAGARDATAMASAQPLENADAAELEGKPAPPFKLKSLDDKTIALSDLGGKVVVLDFWATWCGPCRASLPFLNNIYTEYKPKGVQVFAVNQQEEKQDVQDFVTETKLTVPVLLDSEGKASEVYAASGIPQTVIIGKDGKVRKVFIGFGGEVSDRELRNAIDEAMKE